MPSTACDPVWSAALLGARVPADDLPAAGGCGGDAVPARLCVSGLLLSDITTLEVLLDSLATGGSSQDVEGMRALLRAAAGDPYAAQLLAGFLRGYRTGSAELASFLTTTAQGSPPGPIGCGLLVGEGNVRPAGLLSPVDRRHRRGSPSRAGRGAAAR